MPRKSRDSIEPCLRRLPGRRQWYIEWTPLGERSSRRRSTGIPVEAESPPPEAIDALNAFREALAAGPGDTVSDLMAARYKDAEGRASPVTMRNMAYQHKVVIRILGHLTPDDLTRQRIKRYIEIDRKGRPTSAARELEELRSALRLAGHPIPRDWPAPPKRPHRERFLSQTQAAKLLAVARERAYHLHLFVLIALATGARKSAILGLTWDRVDEERGVVDFNEPDRPVTKKRRPVARVDRRLCAALADARKIARTKWVIEWNDHQVQDVKKGLKECCRLAGVPWASAHTLKHTAISWLAEAGYTVDQISDLTETTPTVIRRIYRKTNPDYLAPLTESLGDRIFGGSPVVSGYTVTGNEKEEVG